MKRIHLYSLFPFLALAVALACSRESVSPRGVTEFAASIEKVSRDSGEASRTSISIENNAGKVSWTAGDEITVADKNGRTAIYVAQSAGETSVFTLKAGQTAVKDAPFTATYGDVNNQKYSAVGANCPLSAPATTSTTFHFSSPYAVVRICATGTGTVRRVIVADYALDCSAGGGVALSSSETVFYVAVSAATYDKLCISFLTDDKKAEKRRKASVQLGAGKMMSVSFALGQTAWKDLYVQIGGVKWATMNIGAASVADNAATSYGNFYVWSDEDIAARLWGGGWHTPSSTEIENLCVSCGKFSETFEPDDIQDATIEGGILSQGVYWLSSDQSLFPDIKVEGLLFSDGSANLFLPAAGDGDGTGPGPFGTYWSNSADTGDATTAFCLTFNEESVLPQANGLRSKHYCIRPVLGN